MVYYKAQNYAKIAVNTDFAAGKEPDVKKKRPQERK